MGRCCRRQDRRNDRQHLSRRLDAAASVFLTYPAGSVAQFLRPWWNHGNSHARKRPRSAFYFGHTVEGEDRTRNLADGIDWVPAELLADWGGITR